MLTCLSLFSGIGGLDLAAHWAGMETVAFCEKNIYCQQVLRRHWPERKIYEDIANLTVTRLRADGIDPATIDLIIGGPPCQPTSIAGLRRGAADERWLWPEFLRVVREVRPRWVLAENPPALLSVDAGRGFGDILRSLAQMGYDASWCVYGAADVGAPHLRERLFLLAHLPCSGSEARRGEPLQSERNPIPDSTRAEGSAMAHPSSDRWNGRRTHQSGTESRSTGPTNSGQNGLYGVVADAGGSGYEKLNTPSLTDASGHVAKRTLERGGAHTSALRSAPGAAQSRLGSIIDGISRRLDGWRWPAGKGHAQHEWEAPRSCTTKPYRRQRLEALGNSVVPQQAFPLLKWITEYEQEEKKG